MKYCLQPCREEVSAGNPEALLLTDPWSVRIFHFSSFTGPTGAALPSSCPLAPGTHGNSWPVEPRQPTAVHVQGKVSSVAPGPLWKVENSGMSI